MQLASNDVNSYSITQLLGLFNLRQGFTEEDLQLSRQKLVNELPSTQSNSLTRPHEIALFVDCACNRLRDEQKNKPSTDPALGTWNQRRNALVKGAGAHAVQQNPNVVPGMKSMISGGRLAESGGVDPGWLNPINIKTTDTAINIDSRFRKNYGVTSASNWSIDLPMAQYKVSSMRIASLELPISYYAIEMSKGNSTFLVRTKGLEFVPPAGAPPKAYDLSNPSKPVPIAKPTDSKDLAWLVILPDGNYELEWQDLSGAEHIVRAMNVAIQNAIPGHYNDETGRFAAFYTYNDWLQKHTHAHTLDNYVVFDVNRADGKGMFAPPQNTTDLEDDDVTDVTMFFAVDRGGNRDLVTSLQLKLGWQLGFRVGSYSYPIHHSNFSFVSESICFITGPHYMYLCVDDGNNNYGSSLIGCFAESTFNKNIMLRVNLADAAMQGAKIYSYIGLAGLAGSWWRSRDYFGPVTISKLKFTLYDEYGRIINLNGMDWSMAIVFGTIYD